MSDDSLTNLTEMSIKQQYAKTNLTEKTNFN